MTNSIVRRSLVSLAAAAMTFPAVSAFAADVTQPTAASFVVTSAADGRIRAGVSAFNKGDFERSISFSRAALKTPLSSKRAAIVHSNLCAAYAGAGDLEKASEACATALEMRPGYDAAETNQAALIALKAQK